MVALTPQLTTEHSHVAAPRTGGQLVCEALIALGVDTLFGYPGGAALPFYLRIAQYPQLRHILVRHEQNAAHAADGYARTTGKVGVCVATSGPGATNLVTGLATAFMDCVPIVAITGQVARGAIGTQAFQEVDIVRIVQPITKAAFQLERAADAPAILAEAFRIALDGRPGPVLIDFPKDVQMEVVERPEGIAPIPRPAPRPGHTLSAPAIFALGQSAELLNNAQRPLIIGGHGVVMSGGSADLLRLAEAGGIPVATTLLGMGAFPERHELALGMVGMHGTVQANLAMHHADLILGIGMRFDDRVVGRARDFAPHAQIVHIDVDKNAFGRVVRADVPVLADAAAATRALLERARYDPRTAWRERLRAWTTDHADCAAVDEANQDALPTTPEVIRALRHVTGGSAILVSDIGQHQMFLALHHGFERPGQFFTSGGLGTMGYALPAAMGAKAAHPGRAVWAVVGDGGFQMSSPELSTLAASGLAVKVLVVNNSCLGMVRQWQELFYEGVYSHSILPQPDFAALARAHGVWGTSVDRRGDVVRALREASLHPGPAVVDVRVPMVETVLPMVPSGATPGDVLCADAVDSHLT